MANKTVTVLLTALTSQYQREMGRAAASTAAVGTAATATTGRVGGLRGALAPTAVAAGKTALAFAGPAALAFGLHKSAQASIGFEADFARVRKTVDGTPQQLDDISLGFRTMSTQMPATTSELTAVGEAAGQLGIKTPFVLDFTEVMAQMGETTNLTADEAAVSLARIANVTQMPQQEFRNLASATVALGNNFAANEQEIVNFGVRLAAAGTQVGLTEAEILGLGTALADIGVRAEAGGTALSRVMSEIDVAVAEGGTTLEQFADVAGTTASQFARTWREDPSEALVTFVEGLGGVREEGGNAFAVLEQLSLNDQRVRNALLAMAGGGDKLREAMKLATDEFERGTALQDEYAIFAGTTQAKIDMLKNSAHNLAIELGEGLAPAYGAAAVAAAAALNSTTNFLDEIENKGLMIFPGFRARINDTTGGLEFFRNSSLDAELSTKRLANSTEAAKGRFDAVAEALGPASSGVDAYGDTAEGTAGQVAELTDEQKDLQSALSNFADPMNTYNDLLAEKEEKEREAAEATAASTKSASDSWEDYAGDVDVSIGEVITSLRKQVRAQEEWEDNLVTIAERGGADIALALAALGPEGAELVAEFATATDKEFRQAARLWLRQTEQGGEGIALALEEKLEDAAGKADEGAETVGKNIRKQIKKHGVDKVLGDLEILSPGVRAALADAQEEADRGGRDTADALTARIEAGRKNVGREMNFIPPHIRATLDDAEDRADAGGKDTATAMTARIEAGRKNVAREMNQIPPHIRATWDTGEDRADRGAKDTADAMTARVTTGRKDVGRQMNFIPPGIRDTMRTAKDRGGTGAENLGDKMNRELAKKARRWARIVDGYAGSISAGLNPVLAALKAGKIKTPRDASIRAIERATGQYAAGGQVPGSGPNRDVVPAMLTPGEHVWTREEVRAAGGHDTMKRLRRKSLVGELHGFQRGGPVMAGRHAERKNNPDISAAAERRFERAAARLRFLEMKYGGIVETGRAIQRMGYRVGEHPAFGGVAPVHSPSSYHYRGAAIDVNYGPPGSSAVERAALDRLQGWILANVTRSRIRELIWRAAGHFDHLHLAMAGGSGLFMPGGAGGLAMAMPDLPKVPKSDGTVLGRTAVAAMRHTREEAMNWLQSNMFMDVGSSAAVGDLQKMAKQMLTARGWGQHWAAFKTLVQKESSWNPNAQNPTSTAYGLGQFLNSTWATVGGSKTSNPRLQLEYMMRYIARRYGNPSKALAFHLRNNWYDEGGLLQPGTTLATNTTGTAEVVAAQGMIRDEVSKGITDALAGRLPRIGPLDVNVRLLTNVEFEEQVRRWSLAWEFGITSTRTRLRQLRKLMIRVLPWSDEWVELFRERQQIVQDLLDEAVAGVEDALAKQADAFDNLNQLLDERSDVMQRIADVQLAFEERRSELIEARRDSLLSALQPEQRMERVWANSIAAVTRNVQGQVEDFAQWAEGLDMLRSMGLSEDAVAALGLEDFTAESLATVQLWSNATQEEVDALNAAIAARQKAASNQAQTEADRMLGGIGDQLLELTRETADEITSLQGELAQIGMDTGRGYAEALAEGLSSGIPGIVSAAKDAQKAIRDVRDAERDLTKARQIARAEPAATKGFAAEKAPLGRLIKTPDVGWYVRFTGPPAKWARVGSQALKHARGLWGPQVAFPNNKPKGWSGGKWLNDVLGGAWWNTYKHPNVAPKSSLPGFARGGIISGPTTFGMGTGFGLAGEAGAERMTKIQPLTRDVTTPHERRVEAAMGRQEQHTKRIADGIEQALDRGDMTIVLSDGVIAGRVTQLQRRDIRREQIADGRATRWRR